MPDYIINLNKIEELQMIKDLQALDLIFSKAKSTIVQGGIVLLQRNNPDHSIYTTDEFSTEPDLKKYKEGVMRYL